MSSLQSTDPYGDASRALPDVTRSVGAGDPPPGDGLPSPGWPAWAAPLALVCGLVLALFGALIVDIPAAALGVAINSKSLPPGLEIADTVVQDAAFVLAAVIVAGMGGRRVHAWQFGLRTPRWGRAVGGIVVLYVAFFLFTAAWEGLLNLQGKEKLLDQLGANENAALLIASALLTCVIAPFAEELLFRGFIFTALRRWGGVFGAAVITGILFGAVHADSAPAAYLVPLGVLGFGLCILYWRTGSLLPCIAAHCINNSIAFGTLENWGWQILVLIVVSLSLLGLVAAAMRRAGLIVGRSDAATPGAAGATPAPAWGP